MNTSLSSRFARITQRAVAVLCCFGCGAVPVLRAQAVSGTILGTVRDSSGATVPNVSLELRNTAAGVVRTITTNAEGMYEVPSLPTGPYTISIEVAGFKKVSVQNVMLSVDQKARVDLTLEPGNVSESVLVEGTVALVQADTSELGTTVSESQVRELPLNGRDFVQLTRLIPGVQRGIPGSNSDGNSSLSFRASASFAANGMRARDNNFMLDGVDNNELLLSTVVIFPSPDALEEFKVQTSTYSAEFGRSLGGVVNIQTKSGTNTFHGNLFEFLRNDKLDANDWFNDKFNRPKPAFRQNQFGGTLGGRIRKDKAFFFMDYQGLRTRQGNSYYSTVPTDAMRQGDYSGIRQTIYDAASRDPFPGNQIPASRFDPVAKNLIAEVYPQANNPGQPASNGQAIQNYFYNPVTSRQDDQFDTKVDYHFGSKNYLFVRYSYERTDLFQPGYLPHGDAATNSVSVANSLLPAHSLAINDTHTFGPHLINELRFGFSRFALTGTPIDYGTNLAAKVGLPGVNISDTVSAFTQIITSDVQSVGPQSNQPFLGFYNVYQLIDNVTRVVGRHTVKAGFNILDQQRSQYNVNYANGRFAFQPQLTSNCAGVTTTCSVTSSSGSSFASLLLGYPSTISRDYRSGITGETKKVFGMFVQDDFKVSDRLTLNLGLRYEIFTPYVEKYNRMANFDLCTGKMVVAGNGASICGAGVGRALRQTYHDDVGPRVGFAWSVLPPNKLVLRGGYGIFYNTPLTGGSSQMTRNFPFGISQSYTTSLLPTLQLSNGIPAVPPLDPTAPLTGSLGSAFDPFLRDGRGQNWNLNLQRQLGADFLVEAAYVGSRGTRLLMDNNLNQAPPIVGVTNQNINRPYYSILPSVTTLTQVQSRSRSWYNAMTLKATKRFARNFMFLGSYTWAKAMDLISDVENSPLNAYNVAVDRALSSFDIRHNFTFSGNYLLPFGEKKFWGGWAFSGIVTLRSGVPFTVTQSQGVLSTGTGNRPNRIGSGTLPNPSPDLWFDRNAFVPTPDSSGTYGNSGRNILSSPGLHQLDLGIVKNTQIGERFRTEFRCELFNALNTPQFASPASTIGVSSAGVISSLLYSTPMRQIQLALKIHF